MSKIGTNIFSAVVSNGLPPDNVGVFITAVTDHNDTAIASIPGMTPEIAKAGTTAMLNTYVQGFQHVWIAAACFVALASIGRSIHLRLARPRFLHSNADGCSSCDILTRPQAGVQ